MATSMRSRSSKRELIFFISFATGHFGGFVAGSGRYAGEGKGVIQPIRCLFSIQLFANLNLVYIGKNFPEIPIPKTPNNQNFQDTTKRHHYLVEDEVFHFLSPMSTFGKAKVGIGGATFALDLGAINTFNWGCLFDLTKNLTKQTRNSGVFQRD